MQRTDLNQVNQKLASVIDGRSDANGLIDAVTAIFDCEAALKGHRGQVGFVKFNTTNLIPALLQPYKSYH